VIDAVGTLIEPVPSVGEVYAGAADRQGVPIPVEEVKQRFKTAFQADELEDWRGPLATDEATEFHRWRRIVANVLPEVPDPDRAFAELWQHFAQPAAWRSFPDALALQTTGLPICVGSNFDRRLRQVLRGLPELVALGLDQSEAIVISSEVGRRKPHNDFYQAAQNRLDLPPESILWVGDDLENDYEGPKRAGLRAILIDRSGQLSTDLETLPDLAALADCLIRAKSGLMTDG
jgi:putative hydrolase of the HAD superfamily